MTTAARDTDATPQQERAAETRADFKRATASLRWLAGIGGLVILAAAWRAEDWLPSAAIGLMTGAAALLVGGLIGLLFGVPYYASTRESLANGQSVEQSGNGQATAAVGSSYGIRPNTNLEQVSDWLTKIIVGVGLVEFDDLMTRLWGTAGAIARSFAATGPPPGTAEPWAQALISGSIVYFSVCGFLFGYLWTRLTLPGWFAVADDVEQRLVQRIEVVRQQLTESQHKLVEEYEAGRNARLRAKTLLSDPKEPPNETDIKSLIERAPGEARSHIYWLAKDASLDQSFQNYQERLDVVIALLRGLIACDTERQYFDNHAQLSYALRRKDKPSLLDEAIKEISEAIRIRESRGRQGHRYYEFHRAWCRILLDSEVSADERELISNDLKAAGPDLARWRLEAPQVDAWIKQHWRDPEQ